MKESREQLLVSLDQLVNRAKDLADKLFTVMDGRNKYESCLAVILIMRVMIDDDPAMVKEAENLADIIIKTSTTQESTTSQGDH